MWPHAPEAQLHQPPRLQNRPPGALGSHQASALCTPPSVGGAGGLGRDPPGPRSWPAPLTPYPGRVAPASTVSPESCSSVPSLAQLRGCAPWPCAPGLGSCFAGRGINCFQRAGPSVHRTASTGLCPLLLAPLPIPVGRTWWAGSAEHPGPAGQAAALSKARRS